MIGQLFDDENICWLQLKKKTSFNFLSCKTEKNSKYIAQIFDIFLQMPQQNHQNYFLSADRLIDSLDSLIDL